MLTPAGPISSRYPCAGVRPATISRSTSAGPPPTMDHRPPVARSRAWRRRRAANSWARGSLLTARTPPRGRRSRPSPRTIERGRGSRSTGSSTTDPLSPSSIIRPTYQPAEKTPDAGERAADDRGARQDHDEAHEVLEVEEQPH